MAEIWIERSEFEPWLGSLRCFLEQGTLILHCISAPKLNVQRLCCNRVGSYSHSVLEWGLTLTFHISKAKLYSENRRSGYVARCDSSSIV